MEKLTKERVERIKDLVEWYIKNIKIDKHLGLVYGFVNTIFRRDVNTRMKDKR